MHRVQSFQAIKLLVSILETHCSFRAVSSVSWSPSINIESTKFFPSDVQGAYLDWFFIRSWAISPATLGFRNSKPKQHCRSKRKVAMLVWSISKLSQLNYMYSCITFQKLDPHQHHGNSLQEPTSNFFDWKLLTNLHISHLLFASITCHQIEGIDVTDFSTESRPYVAFNMAECRAGDFWHKNLASVPKLPNSFIEDFAASQLLINRNLTREYKFFHEAYLHEIEGMYWSSVWHWTVLIVLYLP